jgi:hypothetical protein
VPSRFAREPLALAPRSPVCYFANLGAPPDEPQLTIFPTATLQNGILIRRHEVCPALDKEGRGASFMRMLFSKRALGVAVCTIAALFAALLFRSRSEGTVVPLVFIAVIVLIAARFGTTAGIVSSLISALIFATVMYPPTGHPSINDPSAKANLGYMLMAGLAASFLFLPHTPPKEKSGK